MMPELPAVEQSALALVTSFAGEYVAHSDLATVFGFPLLISHGRGCPDEQVPQSRDYMTLQYALERRPDIVANLDAEATSFLLVATMLLNPEDGKPDNYVVERHPARPDKWRIVCIDNDHSFAPGVAVRRLVDDQHAVGVKVLVLGFFFLSILP